MSASYLKMLEVVLPPWLLRTEGLKVVGGLADVIDDFRDRLVAGVKLRFPGLYSLEGLDKIGRERRLQPGIFETPASYAERLPRWLEDHRGRGNGYAFLEQLDAFLEASPRSRPYEIVSYRGLRHAMDTDGDITRDSITWSTDESGDWAQVWIFIYTWQPTPIDDLVVDSIVGFARDWLPAHAVGRVVNILYDTRLWDYPQPIPTWNEGWDWSGADGPTITEV